jgi:hypothetical protein
LALSSANIWLIAWRLTSRLRASRVSQCSPAVMVVKSSDWAPVTVSQPSAAQRGPERTDRPRPSDPELDAPPIALPRTCDLLDLGAITGTVDRSPPGVVAIATATNQGAASRSMAPTLVGLATRSCRQ